MQDDGGVYFAPLQPSPNESPDSTDANTSDAGGVCSWAHSQPKDRAQLCGGISASRRARSLVSRTHLRSHPRRTDLSAARFFLRSSHSSR